MSIEYDDSALTIGDPQARLLSLGGAGKRVRLSARRADNDAELITPISRRLSAELNQALPASHRLRVGGVRGLLYHNVNWSVEVVG